MTNTFVALKAGVMFGGQGIKKPGNQPSTMPLKAFAVKTGAKNQDSLHFQQAPHRLLLTQPLTSDRLLLTCSWLNGNSLARGVDRASENRAAFWAAVCPCYTNQPSHYLARTSLIMSNLRTMGREDFGWGYTNQTGGGKRE